MKAFRYSILFCAILMSLVQCKHPYQDDDFLGPEITPEDFSVVNNSFFASSSNVDFQSENQSFVSTFSNKVKWTIKIKGLESGALKTLSGLSKTLDASSSTWDGSSDSTFFFKAGEKCVAVITFFNSNLSLSDTFRIKKEKKYDGVLIDDFEKGATEKIGLDSSFTDAGDSGIKISFADSTTEIHGNSSLLLSGTDTNADYWILGVNTILNALSGYFKSVKSNALYVNIAVYGTGDKQASLNVRFTEDDDNSGSFEAANDDAYNYLVRVDWKGWKRLSIPYSSFSDNDTSIGDNIATPANIKGMSLALVSNTSSQKVSLNVDFIILTSGGALK